MFGLFKKKTSVPTDQPTRSTLVPRIKNLQFTAALNQMGIPADQLPLTEPLVADLLVTYAFDLPSAFQMAKATDIQGLGIELEDARSVAIANLHQQLSELGCADHGAFQRIVTGGNLEACILLVDSFWNQIATEIDDEVVATVPSRDVLLFCSSKSQDGIAEMRAATEEVLSEAGTHGLSDRLLVWRSGRWSEFSAQ